MKYRKKPVVIDAIQYIGSNLEEIINNFEDFRCTLYSATKISVSTLEGTTIADIGDWIIRGIKGEFYACKPDIFEASYEKVLEND